MIMGITTLFINWTCLSKWHSIWKLDLMNGITEYLNKFKSIRIR